MNLSIAKVAADAVRPPGALVAGGAWVSQPGTPGTPISGRLQGKAAFWAFNLLEPLLISCFEEQVASSGGRGQREGGGLGVGGGSGGDWRTLSLRFVLPYG